MRFYVGTARGAVAIARAVARSRGRGSTGIGTRRTAITTDRLLRALTDNNARRKLAKEIAQDRLLKELIRGFIDPLDLLDDDAPFHPQRFPVEPDRLVPGQTGYTQRWDDETWQCISAPRDDRWFSGHATDPLNICKSFGEEKAKMSEASNDPWKSHWRHSENVFHVGTPTKGYQRTGTPGDDHDIGHTVIAIPVGLKVSALSPFQMPMEVGFVEVIPIPNEILPLADAIARTGQEGDQGRVVVTPGRPRARAQTRTTTVTIGGNGNVNRVRTTSNTKFPRKPKGKEKKMIASVNNASLLGKLISGVTEGLDLIQAFYASLEEPKGVKFLIFRPTMKEKIETVFKQLDHINGNKLIEELVKNEIEDRFFGKIGQEIGANFGRQGGFAVGAGTGPAL